MNNQFAVVEIIDNDVIVHETMNDFDFAIKTVRNVKRRVGVNGEVVTAFMFDEESEIVNDSIPDSEYVTFSRASEILGVRYQQVFQRAVVKGKMKWFQSPVNHVLLKDVMDWKTKRESR